MTLLLVMMFLKLLDHPVDRLVDRGVNLIIFTAGFERMSLNIHEKVNLVQPPFSVIILCASMHGV